MSNTNDAIAAFLAKGGKVTKLKTGASNNVTRGQWYKASQGAIDLREKLKNGPLSEPKKRTANPVREGERFYQNDWKRSNSM